MPAQDSDFLTTAQGQRLAHTDDSLKVGDRGPTPMDDFHVELDGPGITVAERATKTFARSVLETLSAHRHWDRAGVHPTRPVTQ